MKKVVFVTRRMIMGGIEKSLISMLNSIPKDEYEITVLVMGTGGELFQEIPNHVKYECLYGREKSTLEKLWNRIKKGDIVNFIKTGYYSFLAKISKSVFAQEMYHSKMLPVLNKEFDLAVAYHVPASFPVVFVVNNIKAKTKVAWIHSDVSQYETHLTRYREYYQKYDNIFCVSKQSSTEFIKIFPDLKEKTSIFYNIVDKKDLEFMATRGNGFIDGFNGTRILTIGRLTLEKGQDIIPNVLKKLLQEGHNIRWYLIGEGENRTKIEELINKYKLEKHLVLLGTKSNPYPYLDKCDLYVQPSRHEGYCITLAEARAFKKPIVTTDFVGAREQIINDMTGSIVAFDEHEICRKIVSLLEDYNLQNFYKNNLSKEININKSEMIQFLNLM